MRITKTITPITFILPLISPIFSFLFILTFCFFLQIINDPNDYTVTLFLTTLNIVVFIIPSFILQFNYTKSDKNVTLTIDDSTDHLLLTDNKREFSFKLSEIDRIRIVLSYNHTVDFGSKPWSSYYFYMICLKNDEEFLVTRLVGGKLDKLLNVRVVKQKVFFPFITKYYLNRAKNKQ